MRFPLLLLLLSTTGSIAADWPMLGRSGDRNPVSPEKNAPTDWQIAEDGKSEKNIKWSTAHGGTFGHGGPVVSGGLVWIGCNEDDDEKKIDLAVLACYREADGKLLYRRTSKRLKTGFDWPTHGLSGSPLIEGDRLWYSNNRREIYCLDISPLLKGTGLPREVWKLDMIEKLKIQPCTTMVPTHDKLASPAAHKEFLYFSTGNSTDDSYIKVKAPEAPSLICIRKDTGKLIWSDNSPGKDLFFGHTCTPLIAKVGDKVQAIHPQADGWVRSFDAETGKLIWKFDANPKGVSGDFRDFSKQPMRCAVFSAPVFANGKVYFAIGWDVEGCGSQPGRLCCIDPTKTADISSELDKGKPNLNSGVVWEFGADAKDATDRMHCSVSSVAICDGLVIAGDALGRLHCLDEKTGKHYWSFDTKGSIRTPPMIADGKIYVSAYSGSVSVFTLSKVAKRLAEHEMDRTIDAPLIFANGVLYLLSDKTLYAIGPKK